jgi:predicted Zn-dependent protease
MKYLVIIVAVCCLAAGCATPAPVSVNEALLAGEDEIMLWQRAREEQAVIDNSGWLYRDAKIESYLNEVAAKLNAHSIAPQIRFKIKIINDPSLNAFAFPNGVIYVHTGLLARMENEAQLAALLAHEMTHCTHRHTLRVLVSRKNSSGLMTAANRPPEPVTMFRELAQILGVNRSFSAVSGYTREFEAEADRVGLDLMAKAGYDSRQALNLFEHLQQEIVNEQIKEPYLFGTHPVVKQRIDNAESWLADHYPGKHAGSIKQEIFRSRMDKLLLDNARLDLQIGRFQIARRSAENYLHRHQNDAGAHYLLGEIFRQQDRKTDTGAAIKHYQQAIELDPSFPAPYKAMGLMHYKKGQRRLAKKFFESCLLLSPDAPDKAYIQGYLKMCTSNGEES